MDEDFALVIGLQNYPGLVENGQPSLAGAETDALAFKEWLVSSTGGEVPDTNIKMILSSDYKVSEDPLDAKPALGDVKMAFEKLRRMSLAREDINGSPRIGRRLYLFMSGHGITPTPYGQITKEVGLLMCNVDEINILENQSHIPGWFMADWFCNNGCFDEVFLFMDCCRDIFKVAQSNIVFLSQGRDNRAKRFYAFASKWGRRAKERNLDGKMQGVFTKTLLLALNGAGADPDPNDPTKGIITGASLKSFLINNTKEFLDRSSLNKDDGDEPDIELVPSGNNGSDIIIKEVPLMKFPVILDVQNPIEGVLSVTAGNRLSVGEVELAETSNQLALRLPRGLFCLEGVSNGKIVRTNVFEVKGIEEVGKESRHTLQF